ncbi:DUF1631 domain-containing protein [Ramlibacter sp. WS9]|nr:DUF1631 domain-containing protein [Ramlibacter sp. WS9]
MPSDSGARLARETREQFVAKLQAAVAPLYQALRSRMSELVQASPSTREMHERRDAMMSFERGGQGWAKAVVDAWQKALIPPTATARIRLESKSLELIGDDVVEQKILSSRLALAIGEKASFELNDLRVRMQYLEGGNELASTDVLRPEALAQMLIEQWIAAGLTRESWTLVQDVIHKHILEHVTEAYKAANQLLVSRGVMRDIDLSTRVRRGASAPGARHGGGPDAQHERGAVNSDFNAGATSGGTASPDSRPDAGMRSRPGGGVADETRLMTSNPPLARARARASGVLGRLKRLLSDQVVGYDNPPTRPSPALAQALANQITQIQAITEAAGVGSTVHEIVVYDDAAVQQVATDMRRRTVELKQKAETSNEKATIEIVALMFQSILSEERIPPAIRVWFARLQMPVLRVAISEPEFFGTLEHPARQLIDRMGSCVMGFDAAAIGGTALEVEIKRVVQVIEQYPETGRRVFQLVYDEFQRFLSRFLTDSAPTQRLVSVAQQVEQKETLAIQYTIELRSMLADLPVREEIREFLFKVWAEVLALSAVKNGPQHEETLALKTSASDLVWAASAKPNRQERARVIQDLPKLLQRLRQGMTLVNIQGKAQEAHIKIIGDTLADAFLSKTEAIPHAQIEVMAKRLAHLEDYVAKDPATDLPLDADSIELMLGIDASSIEVVADGGSRPSAAMLSWANELQLGTWFALDHNGATIQVQYVWRSDRRQLHLFATMGGRSYLIQARRLAAYLQAGLLLPAEEEALTVRATRDALAKLDANPERLLH